MAISSGKQSGTHREHIRGFANNLDQLLASISLLVDLNNLPRSHLLVQWDADSQVNTAEPGGARPLSVSRYAEWGGYGTHTWGMNAVGVPRWWLISLS